MQRFVFQNKSVLGSLVQLSPLDTVYCFLLNSVSLLMSGVLVLHTVLKLGTNDSFVNFGNELSLNHHKLCDFRVGFVELTDFCLPI